jgi:two-component system sensor histidine kinase KdpD
MTESAGAHPPPRPGAGERARGRLRIYLGAAPGAGKTHAMLADARARSLQGVDVVIGAIETHGSAETQALARGLQVIPARAAPRAGRGGHELDVDAIVARRPALALIDDLPHRNPEGARHFHRWQDVEEILDHGIDVATTLNVYAIEGLKDLVHALAHMRFRAAVPDSLFERADEVVVVDIAPDDLLRRLGEGKVALPDAQRMRREIFTVETLAALRDLTLRQAAEQVTRQRLAQRDATPDAALWPGRKRILVCIGNEPPAETLIRAGKRLATVLHADWMVVGLETAPGRGAPEEKRERIDAHLALAESLGAQTETLAGFDTMERMVALARRREVGHVLLGRPGGSAWQRWRANAALRALERRCPEMDLILVSADHSTLPHAPEAGEVPEAVTRPDAAGHAEQARAGYAWSVGLTGAATAVCAAVFDHPEPATQLIVYLLGVLFIASRYGFGPSAVSAILSVLASDYLLVPPYFSFAIARPQDAVTLGVFLLSALLVSRLTANLRFQGESARARERRVGFLYRFTKALADVRAMDELATVAAREISRELPWHAVLLLADAQGRIAPAEGFNPELAQWAFDNRKAAGWGTAMRPGQRELHVPVSGSSRRFGVLLLRPTTRALVLAPEQRRTIDTVVSQIGQAMERIVLANAAQAAKAAIEAETLRNSLLSAIAHDFRTPLASIVAASSTLLQGRAQLSARQIEDLTSTILEEGMRMTRLANNTLQMARLESGTVTTKREWYPLEEIVGAVMTRMGERLHTHRVETRVDGGGAMAQVDIVMLVQVLENLVENAIKYTPRGTRLEIGAEGGDEGAVFWVVDEGPGLPPGEEQRVFEKFYRAGARQWHGDDGTGVGLGLTICRVIVEAHGGKISARNRAGGGAEFRFSIAHTEAPPELVTEP